MVQMIRKQVYIQRQQEAALKRLSKSRGLSEAELIRQAIDRQAAWQRPSFPTRTPGRKRTPSCWRCVTARP